MNKFRLALIATALPLLLVGCGNNGPASITASGEDPSVLLEVECDDGGVTAVAASYGGPGNEFSTLVGDDPGVEVLGGVKSLSRDYGGMSHVQEDQALLTVDVAPAKGTCTVRLTAEPNGETLMRKTEEDRDFTLEATVIRE